MAKQTRKRTVRRRKSSSGTLKTRLSSWWVKPLLIVMGVSSVALISAVFFLDYWVQGKFEGTRWSMPARVFARPLELYAGACVSQSTLKAELKALNYRFTDRTQEPGSASITNNHAWLHTRGFKFWDGEEPERLVEVGFSEDCVESITEGNVSVPLIRLEPLDVGSIYPGDHEDRVLVKLDSIPAKLIAGLISVEDKEFFFHSGISIKGVLRAIWVNWKAGAYVQGGSTITQQLVKNFYLSGERSLWRKAVEATMALLLELHYSKDEILETYLNEIYLGQAGNKAIHGAGLASQFYFGQDLRSLRLHETSLLVALIKGPSYFSPRKHPGRAIKRRNAVIDAMFADSHVTLKQAESAKRQPLNVIDKPRYHNDRFPAYLDLVKRQLRRDYKAEQLKSEGLQIFTNLDPLLQKQAEKSLQLKTENLIRELPSTAQKLQGAIIVSHVDTGELLAIVGDVDPKYAGFNRALDAHRPVGSLIKPAIVLTALTADKGYTLASVLKDEAFSIEAKDGDVWTPRNFDDESHGDVLLVDALAFSHNQASAKLGLDIGTKEVIKTLRLLGVESPLMDYPSLLLGAVELSPLQIADMYQTIASNGFRMPLRTIRDVMDQAGEPLSRYPLQIEQVLPGDKTYLLQNGLQQVMSRGTGKSAYHYIPKEFNVAGKTGTSNDLRDSWFVGYSGNYLATVWLGHDDNSPTAFTGGGGALQVWSHFMQHVPAEPLSLSPPAGTEFHWIDKSTGRLVSGACEWSVYLPFLINSTPQQRASCELRGDDVQDSVEPNGVMGWMKQWFE